MKMDNSSYFRTRDLSVASYLYASHIKLIQLDQDNGRFWFVFEDKDRCERLMASFWRKEATVNAKEFADSFRTLKDIIFNKERI